MTYEMQTRKPARKVVASTWGAAGSGAAGAVVVAMLARWLHLDVQPEEAVVVGGLLAAAAAAVGARVAGYRTAPAPEDRIVPVPEEDGDDDGDSLHPHP